MRLCILSTEFPPGPGGIGTHAFELARWLHRLGWTVSVLTPQNYIHPEAARDFNRALPFEVIRISSPPALRPIKRLLRLWIVARWLRRWKPEILLATGSRSVWVAAALLKCNRLPWIAIGHGTEFGSRGWLESRLTRASFQRSSGVVCVSNYTAERMAEMGIRPAATRVIPNGGDESRFFVRPESEVRAFRAARGWDNLRLLLTVGNITQRKGQEVVIRAMPRILEQAPNTHYLMAGLPTQRRELESLAANLGVAEYVHFLGRVPAAELPLIMNSADIFVMTSRRTTDGECEGFGIAVVEAALCGKPSVVSAGSGVSEAVAPGMTGLVVEEGDSRAASDAILKLLVDPTLLRTMGEAARRRALDGQTWADRARHYASFMLELADHRANPVFAANKRGAFTADRL
jgi:glycosyltransferase involved in cell wall biosynthesis